MNLTQTLLCPSHAFLPVPSAHFPPSTPRARSLKAMPQDRHTAHDERRKHTTTDSERVMIAIEMHDMLWPGRLFIERIVAMARAMTTDAGPSTVTFKCAARALAQAPCE